MVDMNQAIAVIRNLRGQLDAWMEIADEHDEREGDYAAIAQADQFLADAGVEHPQ
jgi:hypothetical protein